jgi:hypothetical protein
MNYTLDTAAIRRRFEQAIVGIHPDGCMAILLEQATGDVYMDIVSGGRCAKINLTDVYTALIRPGDRCEFSYVRREHQWDRGTYRGMRFDQYMFQSDLSVGDGFGVYSHIRPLPAAEPKTELDMATILSRIEAAEREIAAAKAALKRVQK